MFNALGKPLQASLVVILQIFVFGSTVGISGVKGLRIERNLHRYGRWECSRRDHRLSDDAEIPCTP